jgi:fumarate reductase subunit C
VKETHYTLHHPKWYRRPESVWWWLEKWVYIRFVLRELTSVFVGLAALIYICQLRALAAGPEAYAAFLATMKSPPVLTLSVITLIAVLFHAATWFHLAPSSLVVRVRGRRVPDKIIIGLNYFAFLFVSGAIAWLWLRG